VASQAHRLRRLPPLATRPSERFPFCSRIALLQRRSLNGLGRHQSRSRTTGLGGAPLGFAQAIQRIEGGAAAGDEMLVLDGRGNTLGRGLYSPNSAIPVRLFTRDATTQIDGALFASRIERALERRKELGLPSAATNAVRLVHAEGDDLPGLVDRPAGRRGRGANGHDWPEAARGRDFGFDHALLEPARDHRPHAADARQDGGLHAHARRGALVTPRSTPSDFVERGLKFHIPFSLGHKTGFYVDQRPLRARIEELARGRRVLDTYSFVARWRCPPRAAAPRGARGRRQRARARGSRRVRGIERAVRAHGVRARRRRRSVEPSRPQGRLRSRDLRPPKLAPSRAARDRALVNMRKLAASGLPRHAPRWAARGVLVLGGDGIMS